MITTTKPIQQFQEEAPAVGTRPGFTIHRIKTPQHNSGMFDQCKAFVVYAKGVTQIITHNDYDMVYATSSRLMTAILGAHIARKIKRPLYLDIRDIFVETIVEVLPHKAGLILAPFLSILERYAINSADKINLVSAGFLPYFQSIIPILSLRCLQTV